LAWRDHNDPAIAGEISSVESKDLPYSVGLHTGNKPCVMNLCAFHLVLGYQAHPNLSRERVVGDETNRFDQLGYLSRRLRYRISQTAIL
jgi:hypothetical protein